MRLLHKTWKLHDSYKRTFNTKSSHLLPFSMKWAFRTSSRASSTELAVLSKNSTSARILILWMCRPGLTVAGNTINSPRQGSNTMNIKILTRMGPLISKYLSRLQIILKRWRLVTIEVFKTLKAKIISGPIVAFQISISKIRNKKCNLTDHKLQLDPRPKEKKLTFSIVLYRTDNWAICISRRITKTKQMPIKTLS